MKKRIFVVFIVSILLILLSSCVKNSPTTPVPTATPTVPYSALVAIPWGSNYQQDGTESFLAYISSFQMGKYEVTYELWYTVYQWALSNGYAFENAGTEGNEGIIGALPTVAKYKPVMTINWRDAIVWCNAYSQKSGLDPVYCSDSSFTTPIKISTHGIYGSTTSTAEGSFDNPYVNWNATGYRLPTESEWQYAASYINGSNITTWYKASGATSYYDDITATSAVAWYDLNSESSVHNVGEKTPNALGLYDMSGNVWEWCWDWMANYPGNSSNYKGPATGSNRVFRGGCFSTISYATIVGYRYTTGNVYPYSVENIGFRVAKK